MLKKQGKTADDNLELDPNVTPAVASSFALRKWSLSIPEIDYDGSK